MATLTFLGQSGFLVEAEGHQVLIDPFITSNPLAQAAGLNAEQFSPQAVLLTHGHFDHMEDAAAIAKRAGAMLVAPYELTDYMQSQGVKDVFPLMPGGSKTFEFGTVRMTNAVHSSSHEGVFLGPACGVVLTTTDGLTLYHAGDTDLFGDMALIGKLFKPDVAILPIGSVFTMCPELALEAAKLIQPKVVIPMHFNTWPPIEQDAQAFKQNVEAQTGAQAVVLEAGQAWQHDA